MLKIFTDFFGFLIISLFFIVLIIALVYLSYLNELLKASSSRSCPLCKKKKAREIMSIPKFKVLLINERAIHFKCKYCGHKWSKELDWDLPSE